MENSETLTSNPSFDSINKSQILSTKDALESNNELGPLMNDEMDGQVGPQPDEGSLLNDKLLFPAIIAPDKAIIIRKYTSYGSISTFKGKQEMKIFKERLGARKEMERLSASRENKANIVGDLAAKLRFYNEQSINSKSELEKINLELSCLMRENHTTHIDPHLFALSRVRFLLSHRDLYTSLLQEANAKMPALEAQLATERQNLQHVFSQESQLLPVSLSIAQEEKVAFSELKVVASHRKKILEEQIAYKAHASMENEVRELKKKEFMRKRVLEMVPIVKERAKRMEDFLQESSKLELKRKAEMKSAPLEINRKKEAAREALEAGLQGLKTAYLSKKKDAAKKINDDGLNETLEIILQRQAKLKKRSETFKISVQEKTMKILDKVIFEKSNSLSAKATCRGLNLSKKTIENLEQKRVEILQKEIPQSNMIPPDASNFLEIFEEPNPSLPKILPRPKIPLVRVRRSHHLAALPIASPPFEFDPPSLIFKELIPDQTYTISLRVINATASPKHFKFLRFSPDIKEFMSISGLTNRSLWSGAEDLVKVSFSPGSEILQSDMREKKSFLEFVCCCGRVFQIEIAFDRARCLPKLDSVGGKTLLTCNLAKDKGNSFNERAMSEEKTKRKPFARIVGTDALHINFEDCVLGDKRKLWLKIINDGSISTDYYLETLQPVVFRPETTKLNTNYDTTECGEIQFNEGPFIVRQAAGTLGGYGSKTIWISFEPTEQNGASEVDATATFSLIFKHSKAPITIKCQGRSMKSTLYPDRHNLDFKTCTTLMKYQEKINLTNKHKISRRFWVNSGNNRSFLHGEGTCIQIGNLAVLTITPSAGFIQPFSSCAIWLKIKFLPAAVAQLWQNGGQGKFETTISFAYLEQATGKESFAPLNISAIISESRIVVRLKEAENNELNYGELSIYSREKKTIQLQNLSLLSQTILPIDTEIFKIGDNACRTFEIGPQECMELTIFFEPKKATVYKETILFKTRWNQQVSLVCNGIGVCPIGQFDLSLINFPLTPFGNENVERLQIKKSEGKDLNPNSEMVAFEFGRPLLHSIAGSRSTAKNISLSDSDFEMVQVYPRKGVIDSQKSANVEVFVRVPAKPSIHERVSTAINDEGMNMNIALDDSLMKVGQQKKESLHIAPEASNYRRLLFDTRMPVLTWLIPCKLTPAQSESARLQQFLDPFQIEKEKLDNNRQHNIYLKVVVPVCDSALRLIEPAGAIIDFGVLAIGKKKKHVCLIQNISDHNIVLAFNGFPPHGPFYFGKVVRSIAAGEERSICIYFQPEQNMKYCDIIELSAGSSKLHIRLAGTGVAPKLKSSLGNAFSFGNVCVGDLVTQELVITNTSVVPASCFLSLGSSSKSLDSSRTNRYGSLNYSQNSPFKISENRASIPVGESKTFLVSFEPDREHDNFFEHLLISYDGQENMSLRFEGKGWENSTIVMNYDRHPQCFRASELLMPLKKEFDLIGLTASKKEEPINFNFDTLVKKFPNFVSFTIKWNKVPGKDILDDYPGLDPAESYWRLSPIEIVLANLKSLSKGDDKNKKPAPTEFQIEKMDCSFEYNYEARQYQFTKQCHGGNQGFSLTLEPSQGIIESGSSKNFKLLAHDPTRTLIHSSYKTWHRLDSVPGTPSLKNLKNTVKNQEAQSPLDCKKEMNNHILTYSLAASLPLINQSLQARAIVLETKIQPMPITQLFKITFRGGARFTEPKGNLQIEEERVFYVKISAPAVEVAQNFK